MKVGGRFGGYCYSTACSTVDWIEVTTLTLRSWGASGHECANLLDSKAMLGVVYAFAARMSHRSAFVILAKLLEPTRLETRTKESKKCASIRVANPNAQWKWFLSWTRLRSDPFTGCMIGLWFLLWTMRVVACFFGPERWWTMPEQSEVRGNSDGSSKRYWRANRSSDLGIGAKD